MSVDLSSPFPWLNSINDTKVDLIATSDDPVLAEKEYNQFMVSRGLSLFPDTILAANEMNVNYGLDNKLHYDFLLHTVRKKKRFSKWPKAEKDDDVELVMQTYTYSRKRAEEVVGLLSPDQLRIMKDRAGKGGVNK